MMTKTGRVWTTDEPWTVAMYPFLDGTTSWTGMTDAQWREVGAIFQTIHHMHLPTDERAKLLQETFEPDGYRQWVQTYEPHILDPIWEANPHQQALHTTWIHHQLTIQDVLTALDRLGHDLRSRVLSMGMCHADLHPANILRPASGQVFIIDWDEVMLAPKERDFIFLATSTTDEDMSHHYPFFQGYGDIEIDWVALTYYRFERVIQDLIACAQDVLFTPNAGEGVQTESVQLFDDILSEEGELTMALRTAANIPAHLREH